MALAVTGLQFPRGYAPLRDRLVRAVICRCGRMHHQVREMRDEDDRAARGRDHEEGPGADEFQGMLLGQFSFRSIVGQATIAERTSGRGKLFVVATGEVSRGNPVWQARVSDCLRRQAFSHVATSAAARDKPGYHIQQHTRHKSAQMVAGYIREADKWTKSGLKGVGF